MTDLASRRSVFGAAAGLALTASATRATAQTPPRTAATPTATAASPIVNIRTYSLPAAGVHRVMYAIETVTGVVMVDAPFRRSDGVAVREWLAGLGKPLRGVVLTHMHPDHYFGLTQMLGGADVPIVATAAVQAAIRAADEQLGGFAPMLIGEAETERDRRMPNTVAPSGQPTRIDGVEFLFRDIGVAESAADSVISLPALPGALFVGDLVMPRTQAFLGNGTTARLLTALEALAPQMTDSTVVYPAHAGVAPARPAIARQIAYVRAAREAVRDIARGRPSLTDAEKQELTRRMLQFEPSRVIEFVIALGADAVAAELAAQG